MKVRTVASVVGVGVFAVVMLFAFGAPGSGQDRSDLVGRRVPALRGDPIEGLAGYSVDAGGAEVRFDIDDHRGEWVLVNFFATWCPPCIAEHPDLVALNDWGADHDLQLVAAVFDDPDTEAIRRFFEQRGGGWPVLDEPQAAIDFHIAQIPESFLVAPNGIVVQHFVSGIRAEDVKATIEQFS